VAGYSAYWELLPQAFWVAFSPLLSVQFYYCGSYPSFVIPEELIFNFLLT